MSKLENWGDLFKYSKELLEDDFNRDQAVVIKTKSRSLDGSTVSHDTQDSSFSQEISSTFKQGTPDVANEESKISFETKFKAAIKNDTHEIGVKQDGLATYEWKSSFFQVRQAS